MGGKAPQVPADSDPSFKPFAQFGRAHAHRRRAELTAMHGQISEGVGELLESAGAALGAARFLFKLAETATKGQAAILRAAATCGDDHRQTELAAFQLNDREAKARRARVELTSSRDDDDDDGCCSESRSHTPEKCPLRARPRRKKPPTTTPTTPEDPNAAPA